MSADGYFVTGDRASIDRNGLLRVYARTEDLIISGGENIYPAEVQDVLLGIPGVKDAYVFGTADETWGYRPVAFIEADYSAEAIARDQEEFGIDPAQSCIRPATCPQEYAHMVHDYLNGCMSKLHHPKHILVMDEFPRTIAGKVDRRALKQRYDKRIDIKSLTLYRVKQPFSHPVKTAQGQRRFPRIVLRGSGRLGWAHGYFRVRFVCHQLVSARNHRGRLRRSARLHCPCGVR